MGSFLKIFILEITMICFLAVEMDAQLRSVSRCSGEMFYIPDNNMCPADTRLLPRKIILGYNNNSNCSGLLLVLRTYWKKHHERHSLCCSASKGDCNETFHLPTDDTKLLTKYKQFLKQCSNVHSGHCTIDQVSSSSPLLSVCSSVTQITYIEFVYECINVTSINYFTVNRTLSSTNPHLILSGILRSECVAYTTDCTSSITVSVADVVLEKTSSCYLSISDGRTNFTTQTCLDHRMYTQPIFSSHTNYIRLNLTTNTSKTTDQLWLQITASKHETVILACGADAYNVNTTDCKTPSTTATSASITLSNVITIKPSKTLTIGDNDVNSTPGSTIKQYTLLKSNALMDLSTTKPGNSGTSRDTDSSTINTIALTKAPSTQNTSPNVSNNNALMDLTTTKPSNKRTSSAADMSSITNIGSTKAEHTTFWVPIIVSCVIGGVIVVVGLIAAFICYRKRKSNHSPRYTTDYNLKSVPSINNADVIFKKSLAVEALNRSSIADDEKIKRASVLANQPIGCYEDVIIDSLNSDTPGTAASNPYDHFHEDNNVSKSNPGYHHEGHFDNTGMMPDVNDYGHTMGESEEYDRLFKGPVDRGPNDTYSHTSDGSKFQISTNQWVLGNQSSLVDVYSEVGNTSTGMGRVAKSPPLRASVEEGLIITRGLDDVLKAEEDDHELEDVYAKVNKIRKK